MIGSASFGLGVLIVFKTKVTLGNQPEFNLRRDNDGVSIRLKVSLAFEMLTCERENAFMPEDMHAVFQQGYHVIFFLFLIQTMSSVEN